MASSSQATQDELEGRKKLLLVVTDRDIVFNCPHCSGELVVDRAGEGMEVPCSHCGQTLKVPKFEARQAAERPAVTLKASQSEPQAAVVVPPPVRKFEHDGLSDEQLARRLDELKHQLKENRSQDTEMRGHLNRANMEVHRLQLRLKTLQERHENITAELAAIQARQEPGAA